jgi:transcriptional regulator with XRE-family HTH domain
MIPMPSSPTFHADYEYAQSVCARLKAFRKGAGFTAQVVAKHLNIPTSLYELYEQYELVPHQIIPPLCELLNISTWHFLTGKSDELSPPFRQRQETLK